MGKTADIDLHSPIPVSALKLDPPPSEAARATWRKAMADSGPLPVVANTPAGPVTAVVTDPKDIAALKQGANPDVSMGAVVPMNVITFADFEKVDIRVGQIMTAGPVPKSDKLLKLEVSFGDLGTRVVLAGIAKTFADPSVLIGQRYAFVVNLAPRKMMGIESHGMLLAAHGTGDEVGLLNCAASVAGAKIG